MALLVGNSEGVHSPLIPKYLPDTWWWLLMDGPQNNNTETSIRDSAIKMKQGMVKPSSGCPTRSLMPVDD